MAWGLAAALWIATGLWRVLAGTEKSPGYYVWNGAFMAKMGLLLLILILELWPMFTLVRWRRARAKGIIDLGALAPAARRIAVISYVQTVIVLVMVLLAAAMARGYGSASVDR